MTKHCLASVLACTALTLASCTSTEDTAPPTTPTTEATTTTAVAASSTSTTLSEPEKRRLAIEQAETDITEVIEAWVTYPYDSSLGEDGAPLDYLTGVVLERYRANVAKDAEEGRVQRSRGGDRVRVESITVDLANKAADAKICGLADHELVDIESGQIIAADDGDAWIVDVELTLIDDEHWKISEFFGGESRGGSTCDLDE